VTPRTGRTTDLLWSAQGVSRSPAAPTCGFTPLPDRQVGQMDRSRGSQRAPTGYLPAPSGPRSGPRSGPKECLHQLLLGGGDGNRTHEPLACHAPAQSSEPSLGIRPRRLTCRPVRPVHRAPQAFNRPSRPAGTAVVLLSPSRCPIDTLRPVATLLATSTAIAPARGSSVQPPSGPPVGESVRPVQVIDAVWVRSA
jgi:hypothetical protein